MTDKPIREMSDEERQRSRISWTAREVFAMAYCWAEFVNPHDRSDTPEAYWIGISERARNECRRVAGDRLLLATARGDAVAVLPIAGLREGELAALKAELGMKVDHRVRAILDAVRAVFKRSASGYRRTTTAAGQDGEAERG